MRFEDLTHEQKEKRRACTTDEELAEFAKREGYELSDDELVAIAGGEGGFNCESFIRRKHRNKCTDYVNPFPLYDCQAQADDVHMPIG